jgi:hypothetical protein
MIKNKQKTTSTKIEKVLAIAGLALIAFGIIANLYGTFANTRFIHDGLAMIYYLQYVLLLGGGFCIGYFMTKKSARLDYTRLFTGATYALLAVAIYFSTDILRLPIGWAFGDFPYPWGRIFFHGIVIVALLATLAIGFFIRRRANQSQLTRSEKIALIVTFIGYQVVSLGTSIYYLGIGVASYGPSTLLAIIVSYLTMPIVITLACYLLLPSIKTRLDRLFYASVIGAVYYTLTIILWEFWTDTSNDSTMLFSHIITVITVIFAGVIVWLTRKAVKK